MRRSAAFAPLLVLALLLSACGGDTPAGSTPPPPVTPRGPDGLAAGAVLTFLSGGTGRPLGGASVTAGERTYVADAAGRVVLADAVASGAALDVAAAGMLDRRTFLAAGGDRTFILWPRATDTGIDEGYTSFLVYGGAAASDPMLRLADGAEVVLVPSADLLADDVAHAMHQAAVDRANEAAGGLARFALARERPAAGVVFETTLDPGHEACASGRIRAQVRYTYRNFVIQGGDVLFCSWDAARTSTVVHEVGHIFGLQHSPNPNDVMFYTFVRGRSDVYSARERLTLALMMRRPGGNRFPDSDPGRVTAAAPAAGEHAVSCP